MGEVEQSQETLSPGKFISELWGIAPKDWWCEFFTIQYRPTQSDPDAKDVRTIFYTVEQVLKDWPTIERNLQHLNRTEVRNIHPCVNPRVRRPRKRGKNSDVEAFVSLWIDVDFHGDEAAIRDSFQKTIKVFDEAGLHPSVIIESGHGLHAYWLLDRPYPVAKARPCCAGLQDTFKIADAQNDPSRVLRMPGTVNLKDVRNPSTCRVVEATWKRYPLEAFSGYEIDPGKSKEDIEEEQTEKAVHQAPPSRDPKIEEAKKGISESGGPYGGRTNAAVALAGHYCTKLGKKNLVLYAMREWNKLNSPPLDEGEVETIVENIWKADQVKRAELAVARAEGKSEKRAPSALWFDEDGRFIPALLAQHLAKEHTFISTPIGRDGRGIDLLQYEGGVFRSGGYTFVRAEVARILGAGATVSRINEVTELVNEYTKVDYKKTNLHGKDLINVQNGMIELSSMKLLPHDPKYRCTVQLPVPFDPEAKSEQLDKFLTGVIPEDSVRLVEEFVGYLMIPDTSFAKCFVAVGEGGNGKSTFLKLITYLIGQENISNLSLHAITEDKFTAAGLFGKLANLYDELETKALENTGLFKQIVSGEAIKAEEKNKAPFSFRPFCRMLFATNQMPRAMDKSQAYFDRFLFVQFPNRIRETNAQIRDYDQVLAKTPGLLSAFLNRALEGLSRLISQGRFTPSANSTEALEEYRRECNSAYDFLKEFCRFDNPDGWIAKSILYSRYRGWSDDSGRKPMSSREFNRTLKTLNVRDVRHGEARGWGGVWWSDGAPPTTTKAEVESFQREVDERHQGQKDLNF
jgi:P4 family phage/plasmid primase-like protien